MIPAKIKIRDGRFYFYFGFNRGLIDVIKRTFENRKWHGPPIHPNGEKVWSAPMSQRNIFRLEHLQKQYGTKPYSKFDEDHSFLIPKIKEYCLSRLPLDRQPYEHQIDMIAHGVHKRSFIWGAEMGTGKTLAAFIVMELLSLWYDIDDYIWVGPKSALRATNLETRKWDLRVIPPFNTYEEIKRVVARWQAGEPAPKGLILDEGSKLKTPTSQRSVACKHLADSIRQDHGDDCCIGIMSGTPAPKSPLDWWHLCEVACPGFLAEKDIFTFKETLAIVEERERNEGAGSYPHLVTYRDDESKCNICGQPVDSLIHDNMSPKYKHVFMKSNNEVTKLHKRMNGLVLVKFKKDCTDLPDKVYEIRKCNPTPEIINIAKLIVKGARSTIDALSKLRMLSDGFQYVDEPIGEDTCELCLGTCKHWEYIPSSDDPEDLNKVECICPNCKGSGTTPKFRRETKFIDCPKDELLDEDLDNHEEIGRLNIYGGFTGTIDKIISRCHKKGWTTIRADGRGWEGKTPLMEILPNADLLQIYTMELEKYPKVAFVGQPGAAGMGLTLTVSPTTVFFSNDFNAENRMQAEDRGHRLGMDRERGGRIVDYVHLDTDQYVLDNLKRKRDLQHMSMTGLSNAFNE